MNPDQSKAKHSLVLLFLYTASSLIISSLISFWIEWPLWCHCSRTFKIETNGGYCYAVPILKKISNNNGFLFYFLQRYFFSLLTYISSQKWCNVVQIQSKFSTAVTLLILTSLIYSYLESWHDKHGFHNSCRSYKFAAVNLPLIRVMVKMLRILKMKQIVMFQEKRKVINT